MQNYVPRWFAVMVNCSVCDTETKVTDALQSTLSILFDLSFATPILALSGPDCPTQFATEMNREPAFVFKFTDNVTMMKLLSLLLPDELQQHSSCLGTLKRAPPLAGAGDSSEYINYILLVSIVIFVMGFAFCAVRYLRKKYHITDEDNDGSPSMGQLETPAPVPSVLPIPAPPPRSRQAAAAPPPPIQAEAGLPALTVTHVSLRQQQLLQSMLEDHQRQQAECAPLQQAVTARPRRNTVHFSTHLDDELLRELVNVDRNTAFHDALASDAAAQL